MTDIIKVCSNKEFSSPIKKLSLKVVCIVENDNFDFNVLENEVKSVDEVYEFIKSKYYLHKNAKWLLLPYSVEPNENS